MKKIFGLLARRIPLVGLVLAMLVPGVARGQCAPDWLPGPSVPGVSGMHQFVNAATTWDPDGAGPMPPWLVVGGKFGIAGGTISRNVAAWDGSAWRAMPLWFGDEVYALAVYNGQLVAGSTLYNSGSASAVMRWDGQQWQAMGHLNASVRALAEYNGELIAGGDIQSAAGVEIHGAARWDGTGWRALASGVTGWVNSFQMFGAQLIVGGGFTVSGVGRDCLAWDGSQLRPFGDQRQIQVLAMTVHDGDLIAAGYFSTPQGTPGMRVGRWDGTQWQQVGDGLDDGVYAAAVYHGRLYVGGPLGRNSGAQELGHIARLGNGAWEPVDDGVRFANPSSHPEVNALTVYGGALVAGGWFTSAGGTGAANVAVWDDTRWGMLGQGFSDQAYALAEYHGQLVAGGVFESAGGGTAHGIAAWDGTSWQELGGGVSADVGTPSVGSFAVYHGQLIAGGIFTGAGGVSANNIAAWDGTAWHALGEGVAGTGAAVRALAVYGKDLIAAGQFTTAGGAAASNIAAWDGTAWRPLGSGVTAGALSYDNTPVVALAVYEGALIVGGAFDHAGGQLIRGLARWRGSTWESLPSAMPFAGTVRTLGLFDGCLVVGGSFLYQIGGQQFAYNIARYESGIWSPLSQLTANVRAIGEHNGSLYAGGDWDGGLSVWTGSAWSPLGVGVSRGPADHGSFGQVNACVEYNGGLWIAGWFLTAGGRVSASVARWGCPCYLNCDRSTAAPTLNVNDFICFLNRFAAGDEYANCDHSTQPPVLNVLDFGCFMGAFAGGCP